VDRANDILLQLEEKHIETPSDNKGVKAKKADTANIAAPAFQLSIFETFDPKIGRIKELLMEMDVNTMSPVECLLKLKELKELAEEGE
ncbi:MAG: hypothetical protein KDD27_08250, partial [Saprospiraceae bacterium]|nr:hypothetical protein [Saprospiraceae bacterium]